MTNSNQTSNNNVGSQRCGWCRGSGRWNVDPDKFLPCAVCGGKGKVIVTEPAVYCRKCHGIGRATQTDPCPTCAGTGWEGVAAG